MSEVTLILARAQQGDPKAAEELLPLVYNELRKLASARMADEAVPCFTSPPPARRIPIGALNGATTWPAQTPGNRSPTSPLAPARR